MKLLIGIRIKAMLAAMQKSFKGKPAMSAFLAIAVVLALISVEGMLFGAWAMMSPFLDTEFAWLFFGLSGLLAFAFGTPKTAPTATIRTTTIAKISIRFLFAFILFHLPPILSKSPLCLYRKRNAKQLTFIRIAIPQNIIHPVISVF